MNLAQRYSQGVRLRIGLFPFIIIKYAGAAYMLYLAWLIARSDSIASNDSTQKKPITFLQACAFQWVNPKAWVMAIGSVSAYASITTFPWNIVLITGVFILIGFVSGATWVGFGTALQRYLHKPKILRAFNIVMAMLLAASLYPVFAEAWR